MNWKNPKQMPSQIEYSRANNRVQGNVFFSSKSLNNNLLGIADSLTNHFYRYKSLPPVMLWLDDVMPNAPQNLLGVKTDNGILLSWKLPKIAKDGDKAYGFVVYRFDKEEKLDLNDASKIQTIYYGDITSWEDIKTERGKTYIYVITSLDRLKNESESSLPLIINSKK